MWDLFRKKILNSYTAHLEEHVYLYVKDIAAYVKAH